MKKRFFLFLVLAGLIFVVLLWFQANRLLNSPKVQEFLTQKIQTAADGMLHYQGLEVGLFPQPVVTLKRPQMAFPDRGLTLDADKLQFDFDIFPMLLGHVEPSAICVTGGKADLRLSWLPFLGQIPMQNFTLKMGALRPGLPVPLQFESDAGEVKHAVVIKGHFVTHSIEKLDWEKIKVRFLIELKNFPLTGIKDGSAGASSLFFFKSGVLSASGEVRKDLKDSVLELSATGKVGDVGYEVMQEKTWVAPPALEGAWSFSGGWDPASEEVKIQKMKVEFPFGNIETNGELKLRTGEIRKIHFTVADLVFENFLKYWPGLENAIPFHIGFSGPSQWGLSLEGTLDHLSLHLSLDLAQTLLTYGAYFAKPKDVPLTMNFDYLVQKGESLSGDFSLRFQDMSLKGNLTDLKLADSQGQVNILTNKFSMKGWEKYIPILQRYKLDGNIKVLANWKGDLRNLEKTERINHVTIEQGVWTDEGGKGIRNADLSFDYSPLMLDGRGMKFEIGGSPVTVDLKMTGSDATTDAQLKLLAADLDPARAWEDITALFRGRKEKAEKDVYDHVQASISGLFPKGQKLQDVLAELHYGQGDWQVQKFISKAYGGEVDLKGALELSKQPVAYRCEGNVRGVELGSFLGRAGDKLSMNDGSLAMQLALDGTGWGKEAWTDSLKGHGKFTAAKGHMPMLDALTTLGSFEVFRGLKNNAADLAAYEQVDFNWQLAQGKVVTEDFLIKGATHVVDGNGTVGFDGLVNMRWDVFLSTALAAKIFPEMSSQFLDKPQAHLGPIPMLVTGPLTAPELKPDPGPFEEISQAIREQETRNLLYELVLE